MRRFVDRADSVFSVRLRGLAQTARRCTAGDRAREQRLRDCTQPVVPGHEYLAPVVVERFEDGVRDVLRLGDDRVHDAREDGALWKALRLDEARHDEVDAYPSRM